MDMQWYVARVYTGRENAAAAFLRMAGIECYFPQQTRRYRIRGKNRDRSLPLVRGYVFVNCPSSPAAWAVVDGAREVLGLLCYAGDVDGLPCPVSGDLIADIQAREDAGEWDGVRRAVMAAKRKRYERRWRPLNELAAVVENVAQEGRLTRFANHLSLVVA